MAIAAEGEEPLPEEIGRLQILSNYTFLGGERTALREGSDLSIRDGLTDPSTTALSSSSEERVSIAQRYNVTSP